MKSSPESTTKRTVPVLSISPVEDDHCALQDILRHLQSAADPNRTFMVKACTTLRATLTALPTHPFELVVCESDLIPGSWKDVLEETVILPDPPPLIVTSRLADERLWAEALNLGAFDVLAKPFERTETTRVLEAALRTWSRTRKRPAQRERFTLKVAAAHA